jgi:hypothetical protein
MEVKGLKRVDERFCEGENRRLKLRALARMHYGLYTVSTYDVICVR